MDRNFFLSISILAFFGLTAPASGQDAPDAATLMRNFDAIERSGGRAAVQEIQGRIQQGLPAHVLTRAVAALGRIGDRNAAGVLISLARHRRPAVRAQVAEALGGINDTRSRQTLATLLDDSDASVRSAAALALGLVGAQSVMPAVMQAAARGVPEAAQVLGQQASAGDVARLLRSVNAQTLPAYAPALRVFLLERQDLPARTKQSVVAALGQIRGVESERVLREAMAALPAGDALRTAVEAALARITATEET